MTSGRIVKQWLDKADKDLSIAQADVNRTERAEYVAFNCQQAAEKYLKAYIIANKLEFKYTHDLVELNRICEKKDNNFAKLRSSVEELTPFYIESRYPEFIGGITKKRAKVALRSAKAIAKFVKANI